MIQLALLAAWIGTYLLVSGLLKVSLVKESTILFAALPVALRKKVTIACKRLGVPLDKVHYKKADRPFGLHIPSLGQGKVYLSTKAVELFSSDELQWILAHEFGHQFLGHAWWHVIYSLAFLATSVYSINQTDSLVIRLILAVVLGIIFGFTSIYLQKQSETQANMFALVATNNPQAQISATHVFAQFYNHNSLQQAWWKRIRSGQMSYIERIKQAERYRHSSQGNKL